MTPRTVDAVVTDALERGSLIGTASYGRTLMLDGRRRFTIRVQSDVYRQLYDFAQPGAYYPDLTEAIRAAVASWRAQRDASATPGSVA